jgi:hypothetical protein
VTTRQDHNTARAATQVVIMQPIYNLEQKQSTYSNLKDAHQTLVEKSDIWNWNSLATTTRSSLQRVLHLDKLVRAAVELPGDIFEFGCHYGASTCIMHNLLEMYEPHGYRMIHAFDTFEGFPNTDHRDSSSTEQKNKKGDFNIKIDKYETFLDGILQNHRQLDLSPSKRPSYTLNKGDASATLPIFLKARPATLASMVIFDMDIFEPTSVCLKHIESRLVPGAIIVFDELLSFEQFPGESLALQSCTFRHRLKPLVHDSLVPFSAVFQYF